MNSSGFTHAAQGVVQCKDRGELTINQFEYRFNRVTKNLNKIKKSFTTYSDSLGAGQETKCLLHFSSLLKFETCES